MTIRPMGLPQADTTSRAGLPVRWHLTALALGAALPGLVLVGLLAGQLVRRSGGPSTLASSSARAG